MAYVNNIDLSCFSYDELNELQKRIEEEKEKFIEISRLEFYNDEDGELHLCYCNGNLYTDDPYDMNYYTSFFDVFTKEKVCSKRLSKRNDSHCFYDYLINIGIEVKDRKYSRNELSYLWNSVKSTLIADLNGDLHAKHYRH